MIHLATFILLADSAAPAAGAANGQQQGSPFGMFVPMILMFVIFYFLVIRPQRKRQQELQQQVNALRGGDTVITTAGIHGIVSSVQQTTVVVKIADNVKVKMEKSAVASIVKKSSDADVIDVSDEATVVEEKKD